MKNKKNIIAIAATLILALSAVTISAAASFSKGREKDKIETMPEIVCASSSDNCNSPSMESFVKNMSSLTEKEKATLIDDLNRLEEFEKQIDDIYARMTDDNADKLYNEIDGINDKITEVLERNTELCDRVSDEYDVKVAANDPDMAF